MFYTSAELIYVKLLICVHVVKSPWCIAFVTISAMFCWLLLCFYALNIKHNMHVSKYLVSILVFWYFWYDWNQTTRLNHKKDKLEIKWIYKIYFYMLADNFVNFTNC